MSIPRPQKPVHKGFYMQQLVITPDGRLARVVDVFLDDTIDVIYCDKVAAIEDAAWATFRMDEVEIALADDDE